ncbi:formimidoylglutamase [Pelosinus propionicus]|uniref:Formimidoylglutamase n=1 Tax=Pelosinus propionicus DSM 13327 TaxID=1123291 RepID=A0A1I4ISD6_9FIRM|nr:formimidoylglutamase [Pelosinus propionicus]SFL57282.1 formiminoglutamase [Pelosinus propionicus DSM 13327]
MFQDRYETADFTIWQGRVDSKENFDAFRWHQWIKPLDLRQPLCKFTGKIGFALLGFCCDEGIRRNNGRQGASSGPEEIRRELTNLPCSFSSEVLLFDAGNITCADGELTRSQMALEQAVIYLRQAGLFPLVMGGGHETALGHFRGQADFLRQKDGKCDLGILNFDAHFDLRPFIGEGNSGTMFRQIAEDARKWGEVFHYFCLGIQRSSNTLELFKTAQQLGAGYLLAGDISMQYEEHILEKIDSFVQSIPHLYVTICADVFSSSFAPGVSAPQPLGLHPEIVLKYLKHILRTQKVVGFDIAEVSPRFDHDRATASLAKVIIFAVVDTLCRLKGLAR